MNKKDENFAIGFFGALFIGVMLAALHEELKTKSLVSFKKLSSDLDKGFETDAKNLQNDWSNIRSDFSKSYEKLKKEYNIYE